MLKLSISVLLVFFLFFGLSTRTNH